MAKYVVNASLNQPLFAAEKEGIIVKGTLWVVEQLIRQNLLSINDAKNAYLRMKDSGRRLPWTLSENKLQEIEQELLQN